MIEALNQQDNLIRALFLDSLQPALISDADTLEILIANKACIEALKVDENDVIGHKWSDFFGLKEGIDISGSISVVKIVIGKSDAKWASVTAQYIQYEGRSVVIMRFSVFENQFQDLEQLEYNRKLYNDVFDQSYDAKLLTKIFSDGSFGDFTCNKRALELFEIHDASVFYSDRYRFFDDDVDVYALSKKAIQDGFIELELKMKTYAGITFWGLLKISKILVSYDEYLLTSIVDISVNKQTLAINAEREAKLVENEAYLKSIINTLPNPLFVKTMEGKFLLANEAFAKLVGQTPESIVSKTEVDINSDIDIVRTYFEHDKKVLDEGRTIVFSEEYLNDKGETKQLLTYKKPYLTLDGSSQIIGAILDVTNIVELEKELSNRNEMFEVIFKNSSDALFIVSENDIIQDVNDTCVNMFRMPKYDLIGKRGVTLQKNQFNEQKTASIYELLNSQKYFQTELQYIRGDGTEFCGLFSITLFELHGVQLALVRVADIDDQKQLARELQFRTEIFEKVFNNSSDALFLVDQNFINYDVNVTAVKMFRIERSKLLNMNGNLLQKTPFGNEELNSIINSLNNTGVFNADIEYVRGDGSFFWGLLTITQININNQNMTLVRIVDIDEQRKVQKQLDYRNDLFSTVVNNSNDAIFLLDDKDIIIDVNDAAVNLFRTAREQLIGHYGTLEMVAQVSSEKIIEIKKNLDENYHYQTEVYYEVHDGSKFWGLLSINIIDYEDSFLSYVRVANIDSIKAYEKELAYKNELFIKVFDNSSDAIFIVNEDGTIKDVSNSALTMFGKTRAQLIGTYGVLLQKEPFTDEELLKIHQVGELDHIYQSELEYVRIDGSIFWGLFSISSFVFDGEVLDLVRVADIDKMKQIEHEQAKMLDERNVLIKEVHHRVKNNLAVVSGLLQLQSSYFKLPEVKNAFKDSQNRIRGMALIHEMLYKSNDFTSIDFSLYIRSLVLNIQRTYKIPCQVTINYDLESINLNLITAIPCGLIINEAISNSYKHAFQGRKRGVVSISFNYSNFCFCLEIKDDGVGFPEQVDLENSSLGMTLIHELSRQLHGELSIVNDGGTRLYLKFQQKEQDES